MAICGRLTRSFADLSMRSLLAAPQPLCSAVPQRQLRVRKLTDQDYERPNSVVGPGAFSRPPPEKSLWSEYNEVVYPPNPGEPPRPAEVTHERLGVHYSRKKLWYLAFMIRGLSIEEAMKQLAIRPDKGARIIEESLKETVDKAVKEHNLEYMTNLWVEMAHVKRGSAVPRVFKGLRRNIALKNYHYANLYLRLREGPPPRYYHPSEVNKNWGTGYQAMRDELERLRKRRIFLGL